MEEELFPRGGAERTKKDLKEPTQSSETKKSRKRANSKDFLFGSKDAKPKKSKKSKDSVSNNLTATSSLPLGGGGVLQPTQSASSKKPAFIEAISFQKLAKGTKLIGIVKEVASEYAVISLPNMLTGFVRSDTKSGVPLDRVLSAGQILPVVVVKATSETVKSRDGSSSQMKRRIELSVSPATMNNGLSADMLHERMNIRGKIRSVEDHGCIIDLHVSGLGGSSCFLQFDNIKGKYRILEDEEDDETMSEEADDIDFQLNKGRIYDFTIKSLPAKTKKETSSIIQLELETNKSRSKYVVDAATHLASNHSIRTLTPGMLVKVDVEHFARNGLCVSILGNVYRGAIDSSHLGGYLPENAEESKSLLKKNTKISEMWWKNVFVGKNRSVSLCSL
jgi:ribosomal protein S1